MNPETGLVRTLALSVATLSLALTLAVPAGAASPSECEPRTMRVSFYTCEESSAHCLTRNGHQPIPFRTVAVGDRALLGRWLYIEDLGGWVFASDTGGALKADSLDVFIGEGRMAKHAKRLGVQFWEVRVCGLAPRPVQTAQR
jgi:3D (Asp-Asp-Asp) domain-containing protein